MKKSLCLTAPGVVFAMFLAAIAQAQPANNDCTNAMPIANGSVTPFNTSAATRDGVASCLNFSAARDIWFTYTCSSAEHVVLDLCGSGSMVKGLAAFSGGCGGTELACNRTGGCGSGQPQLAFDTPGAGMYHIYLATLQSSGDFGGILTLNATPLSGQPTRDTCAQAYPVGGTTTVAFDTAGLTTDGTSSCGGLNDGWFTWMPTKSGFATATTCRLTSGDTVLSAYSGCGGSEIICNNDSCGTASQINFAVTFGVPVLVRIASPAGEPVSGQVSFSVSLTPPNDTCANAQVLPGLGGYQVDNTFATTQGPSGSCNLDGEVDSHDLFFSYTAGNEGYITADTLLQTPGGNPTTLNTTLQILDGCGGAELACNDNANDGTVASRTCPLAVTQGHPYIIRVAVRGARRHRRSIPAPRSRSIRAATWNMPADAIAEPGNPCADWIDDPNRGCDNSANPPTQSRTPIVLCQNYKGTAPSRTTLNPYGNLIHDADIYTFTLDQPSIVTVTGQTRFKALCAVWSGDCPTYVGQLPVVYPAPCSGVGDFTLTIPDVLQPGVHNFVISNWFDLSATCGVNDEYWFRVTTNHPCPSPACAADLDNGSGTGTPDGGVDINDLLFFLGAFEAGTSAADLDNESGTGTPDGGVDINDLLFFLTHFELGC